MTESNYDDVWDVLYDYDFHQNISNKDVLCVLCYKVMIDPYTAYCGCHYCGNCIRGYVENEKMHCTGNNNECLDEYLYIGKNVFKDIKVSNIIANMMIKCPNELCSFETKLKDIKDHIFKCKLKTIECPYKILGCSTENVTEDRVNEHLELKIISHSHLLIECLSLLRKDMNKLRQVIEVKENEISKLKDRTEKNEKEIGQLKEICEIYKKELNEVNVKNERNKKEIYMLNEQREINKNRIIELNKNEDKINREIKELRKEIKSIETDITEFMDYENNNSEERQNKYIIKNEPYKSLEVLDKIQFHSLDNLDSLKNEKEWMIGEKFKIMKTKRRTMFERKFQKYEYPEINVKNNVKALNKESINMNYISLKPDYIWKIKDFNKKSEKYEGVFYSNSFYIDNYKFCMRLQVDNSFVKYLSFYVHLVKGKKDEKQEWPLRHTVLINLFNQLSLKTHESWMCHYNDSYDKSLFHRPKSNINNGIFCGGISVNDVRNTQGLLVRDCVHIYCFVTHE